MKIKNPIVNSIINVIFLGAIWQILMSITYIVNTRSGINGLNSKILNLCAVMCLVIIYILIYRKKFKEIITTKKLKTGLILGLPILLLIFGPYILNINIISTFNLSLYGIIFAIIGGIIPGISEEIVFRGALINGFMEKNKKENYIPIAVLLSAILFALIHLTNIFVGANLNQTIIQVVYTFAFGAILAAIFLRTGNILALIFYHSLMDFIKFLEPTVAQTGKLQTSISLLAPESITKIVVSVVLIIFAFYYIRSEKRGEIIELWNLKKI